MDLAFVIPGHYTSNDTLDSESKVIIRVLGEGDKKDHFKVLNEKREYHENEILSSYTYTPTAHTDYSMNTFEIGDIESSSEKVIENDTIIEIPHEKEQFVIQEESKQTFSVKQQELPKKSEDDIFVENLLTKIVNENQETLCIPINFSFKYDIDKLKSLIQLLDIDKNTTNLIIDKLIDTDLKDKLIVALKQTINNLINNNITTNPETNIFQNNVVVKNSLEEIPLTKNTFQEEIQMETETEIEPVFVPTKAPRLEYSDNLYKKELINKYL